MTFDDKWPILMVSGADVTLEQAGEIIRRTDCFFLAYGEPSGNDHAWIRLMEGMLSIPRRPRPEEPALLACELAQVEAWARAWGVIRTHYVHNDWLSSNYISGPNGWCRPDGKIGFFQPIGKYPGQDEVLADWQMIAAAFPFLRLAASVFYDDAVADPSYTIGVHAGQAVLHPAGKLALHEPFSDPGPSAAERRIFTALERHQRGEPLGLSTFDLEHAEIPAAWLADWAQRGAQIAAAWVDAARVTEDGGPSS